MIEPSEIDLPASERAMLVRFCLSFIGDPDAAEDLAQQTLFTAWRQRGQLRAPEARRSWLLSIARHACLSWGRSRGRERAREQVLPPDEPNPVELIADDFDLQVELEREELAALLDRALALLPAETREVLVRRYVEESPQAEVAALMGLSEGAVEARLHRGKLALRRILGTELGEETVALGLMARADAGWQETRLWCPGCGRRRLLGLLDREAGTLQMRCPDCSRFAHNYINSEQGDDLRHVKTFKPAVSHVLRDIHQTYRVRTVDGVYRCHGCGQPIPVRRDPEYGIHLRCYRCAWWDRETWHALTWSLPEARGFWRENPRMRFLGEREIEADGVPAVVTGLESLTGGARLEVVSLRDTLEVIRVEGTPTRQRLPGGR